MAEPFISYDKSPAGFDEIEVPVPHGPHPVRRMLAKDFPSTAVRYVEESLRPNPYQKSMPRKSPTDTLHHFIGAAKGLKLMDESTLKHMDQHAVKFESAADRGQYFEKTLKPFLLSMVAQRRQP